MPKRDGIRKAHWIVAGMWISKSRYPYFVIGSIRTNKIGMPVIRIGIPRARNNASPKLLAMSEHNMPQTHKEAHPRTT